MAKVIPYADPNAHGSIANSISFRRRYNSVVLQKKPFPVQPNTPAQLTQREKFHNASDAWFVLDAVSKVYYNTRGKQLNMSGRSLFIHAELMDLQPSHTPLTIDTITAAQLMNLRGPETESIEHKFRQVSGPGNWGWIYDTENIFHQGGVAEEYDLFLEINNFYYGAVEYEFRDALSITTLKGAQEKNFLIRLPHIELPEYGNWLWLYVAKDGSVYYDQALTQLAATNNF